MSIIELPPTEIKIYCRSCPNEISSETNDKNNGRCNECMENIRIGRLIIY